MKRLGWFLHTLWKDYGQLHPDRSEYRPYGYEYLTGLENPEMVC